MLSMAQFTYTSGVGTNSEDLLIPESFVVINPGMSDCMIIPERLT